MWKLSRNFEEKWLENIGSPLPTSNEIDRMIKESIIVQKQRDLFTSRGRLYRVLAICWHPGRDVVFKVDHKRRKVVTLISARQEEGQIMQTFSWYE